MTAGRVYVGCALRALVVGLCAVTVAGCGGGVTDEDAPRAAGEGRTIRAGGVTIELPPGWDAYTSRTGPDDSVGVIWAGSTRFLEPAPPPEFPHETLAALPGDGIAVEIVVQPPQVDSPATAARTLPLRLADGYFLAEAYEGQPASHVSSQIIDARVGDVALYVQVFFGRNDPDEEMRARADRVLAALTVVGSISETSKGGLVRFHDAATGVAGRHPEGWYRARALTNLAVPREVLALASYPLLGSNRGGGACAPRRDLDAMPADGAFAWLLEYRPFRDERGVDLPLERFPPRPARFAVRRSDLHADSGCGVGLGRTVSFRAEERPFQLLLVVGERASDERLRELEEILNSLEFERLPPPPPDPYAGWPLLVSNSGDSLRPPPKWAAAAAMFPPDKTPRPRTLFFASNSPLFGLPDRLLERVDRLPPDASWAVANSFPTDGVLLWVTEEEKGGAASEFPAIGRGWPGEDDFELVEILTKPNPDVRWRRAGGSFRGYRFSVLIGIGPEAAHTDFELALNSAASLAVSGCWRDVIDDCPDG